MPALAETKRCKGRCGELRPVAEFHVNRRNADRLSRECVECIKAYQAEWREKNRAREAERNRVRRANERAACIAAYGGCCACCGEDTLEFLALDHVDGVVPDQHRSASGKRAPSTAVYRDLRRAGYPQEGYRVLCHNCNMAIAFYGRCPHERRLEAVS